MTASYKRIDYRLRPSKHAERRMLCDAFRRIRFASLYSYQYVGLASVFFGDFELFHRDLGFAKMVCIEKNVQDEPRFRFNAPFGCIDFLWGTTGSQLPNVDWRLRSIVWLDYDKPLDVDKLEDLAFVAAQLASGSMLIVSVAAPPPTYDENAPKKAVTELAQKLPEGAISAVTTDVELLAWGTAKLFWRLIDARIRGAITTKNAARHDIAKASYEQVFHFQYEDGTKMLTVGGVIFDEAQRNIFEACAFRELDFVRVGIEPVRIERPLLTLAEIRMVEKSLPTNDHENLSCPPAPDSEARKLSRIYRYHPRYEILE